MSYDDIMCRIEEMVGDPYQEGYESGWQRCASQATHDYADEWCDGFLTAWNANAATKTYCENVGDAWHFECSRCDATAMQGVQLGANVVKFKYCPNCGSEVTACGI